MTIQTNAQNTYAAIGIREDLTDIVALIDPQETPFISNIGTGPKPGQTKHEWQVQPLAAASKTNFQLEGDDTPSAAAATNRERLFNYCAISRKVGSVTGTMQEVVVAGIANELDNQKMLKAVELRRDMEVILLDNNAYAAGGTTTARECAGLAAYITNGASGGALYTGGGNYSAAAGTGADAWNLSSTTAGGMTLTALNSAVQDAHIDGGKPDMLMLSPRNKTAFSNLTLQSSLGGAAQIRYNLNGVRPGALIGAVDTWLSNFGMLDVMSNVQMASDSGTTNGLDDTAYLIDSRYAKVCYLRPMGSQDLAKTGDATKFMTLAEYTLQVDAPKAHAAVFAIA
jgi:hypothetical protein